MRFPSYIFDAAPVDARHLLVLRSNPDNLTPGFLELWDIDAGRRVRVVSAEDQLALRVATRGSLAASDCSDGSIRTWSVPDLTYLRTIESKNATRVTALAFFDDDHLLVGSREGFDLLEARSGRRISTFAHERARVLDFAVTTNRDRIVTACDDRCVRVWATNSRACIATLTEAGLPPYAGRYGAMDVHAATGVCLLPGDQEVVASYGNGALRLWDLTSGELVRKASAVGDGPPWLISIDASPDGRSVVAGSWDTNVWIWDLQHAPLPMSGHIGEAGPVHFLDDQRAVSVSFDQTIRVWNTVTRRCTRVIGDAIRSSRFPPNESMW